MRVASRSSTRWTTTRRPSFRTCTRIHKPATRSPSSSQITATTCRLYVAIEHTATRMRTIECLSHSLIQFKYWTTCGDTECSFPFLFTLFPSDFLATRPDAAAALHANQQRLVTGYDVFATLHQLFGELGGEYPTLESIRNTSTSDRHAYLRAVESPSSSAKSLFEPVPNRTCAQAGIPNKFCRCR